MLDQLLQMIQQSSQQAVVENNEVPNEHNEALMNEAQNSIIKGLSSMVSNGQINSLMESVQNGQTSNNPAVQQISNNFMGSIMEKFGINSNTAASIASSIIPMVIGKMMSKGAQNGSNGGFDLGSLISALTAGNKANNNAAAGGGNFMDMASSIGAKMGLDKDGDGDVDLNDIVKMFK
jgi:uncharacterized protein YidB (DUF937 family)